MCFATYLEAVTGIGKCQCHLGLPQIGNGVNSICVKLPNKTEIAKIVGRNVFCEEVAILSALRGAPNVIQLLDVIPDQRSELWWMIFRLMDATLETYIDNARTSERRSIPMSQIRDITAQVLNALNALHARGIIHADLKPDNILVQEDGNKLEVRVCDFGGSYRLRDGKPICGLDPTTVTTPNYRAPEVWKRCFGVPIDMWALGCILFEMVAQQLLIDDASTSDEYQKSLQKSILDGDRSVGTMWSTLGDITAYDGCVEDRNAKNQLGPLLVDLLARNPKERITAPNASNHPFVAGPYP
jgi:serine/threonine protein kinase